MRMLRILVVSLLLVASIADIGSPEILGVGGERCGTLLTVIDNNDRVGMAAFKSWMGGFLTAFNDQLRSSSSVEILEGADGDAVYRWIESYCRQNPLDRFMLACTKVALELAARHNSRR